MAIRLIVGLGNPGAEYEATRHNAGFWFVEAVARAAGASFSRERRFFGEVARARIAGADTWLLKPATFMNRSGQAVAALANFHRIGAPEVLVAHDELDLPPGTARIKRAGGSGGHNGLKDLAQAFGADTWRLRIGIGHPRTLGLSQEVVDFVLSRPRRDELDAIERTLPAAQAVLGLLVGGRFEAAMQQLHNDPAAGAVRGKPASAPELASAAAPGRPRPGGADRSRSESDQAAASDAPQRPA